ncbi:MAG: hypothetical protein GXP40_05080 [Chloroflexi bacterium]|nr:hypothetical protein [Chloroflexota bacterium]
MTKTCLNCERTEQEIPLLNLNYRDETLLICPRCLPLLIHKPEKLVNKIPGIENLKGLDPSHEH